MLTIELGNFFSQILPVSTSQHHLNNFSFHEGQTDEEKWGPLLVLVEFIFCFYQTVWYKRK